MKLIKKIAAIMFAFMMVISMSTNVSAEGTNNGTITINNAVDGQTYTIYKLLDLESYTPDPGTDDGIYSYKPNKLWKSFLESAADSAGTKYFEINENGYATWKGDKTDSRKAEFAQKALAYAKDEAHPIAGDPRKKEEGKTLTFTNLSLGYYLVDSSVGTLCSLDTTKPAATIQEKNGVPSVDKIITSGGFVSADGKSNSASIGDTVYFKTTITAQPGAQNYVLHDKMTDGLTFNNKVEVKKGESTIESSKYTLNTTGLTDGCAFEIEFKTDFCDTLNANDTITVTYSAVLNEKAEIGNVDKNKNETWLKYGDSQNTQHKTTTTKTFEMNVFKFYKDKKNSDKETGLAGATFKLTKDSQDAENISFVKTSNKTATNDVYRVAKKGEAGTITTITSPKSGKFTIQGLGAGTYYLTETKQPDGYNKLSGPVTVVIDKDGQVKVKNGDAYDEVTQVKVENKSGTVLPSTGGAGTTMIYLIGGALVLGSGVVLATKRRVKNK